MEHIGVINSAGLLLAGMSFFGNPFRIAAGWTDENEIGRLWTRFMTFVSSNASAPNTSALPGICEESVFYEVHITTPEGAAVGAFEVFVGMEAASVEEIPIECVAKWLPPTRYAAFLLMGEEISSDWNAIIVDEWVLANRYRKSSDYTVLRYDSRYKGLDALKESALEVWVPICDDAVGL